MPYNINFTEDKSYIFVNVQDPMNYLNYQKLRDDLLAQCNNNNMFKAIINLKNCDLSELTSKYRQYIFCQEWKNIEHHHARIAVVLPDKVNDQDQVYFVIDTLAKKGSRIIPFYDVEAAVIWATNET